jgi:membrane-associated protease RseP (regulator of RpoE activity)
MLSSIVFSVAMLCPAMAHAQGPASCGVASQNLWVRDQLNDVYYWYQHMPTGVSPLRFNSPEAYLEAVRYRPIDNFFSYIQSAAASDAFYSDSQTIKYGFTNEVRTNDVLVLQVWPDSGAADAGLERGDRIVEINGTSITTHVAGGTLNAAFGPDVVGQQASIVLEKPSGERKAVQMTKRLATIPTVSVTRLFDVDGRRVGYVVFNNFVQPSTAALNDAFAALKTGGATELVLDLRYNGGGLVDVARHLASLIGGARTDGQVAFNYVHNDKIGPELNKVTRFTNPENALNLQRLVVIAKRGTASASELVINALRAFIPVTIVGDNTYGKPVGSYGLRFCDKILFPIAFSIKNANLEGDYFDGLPVDCPAADDASHQLGDPAEGSLAEALTFLRTGGCTPRSSAENRALRLRPPTPRLAGWDALINAH